MLCGRLGGFCCDGCDGCNGCGFGGLGRGSRCWCYRGGGWCLDLRSGDGGNDRRAGLGFVVVFVPVDFVFACAGCARGLLAWYATIRITLNEERTSSSGRAILLGVVLLQPRDEVCLVARDGEAALAQQLLQVGDLERVVVGHLFLTPRR